MALGEDRYIVSHTVLIDIPFDQLQAVISKFLSDQGWYTGEDEDDNLRKYPILKKWKDQGKSNTCSVITYASRLHYSIIGSGTSIKLFNLRSDDNANSNYSSKFPFAETEAIPIKLSEVADSEDIFEIADLYPNSVGFKFEEVESVRKEIPDTILNRFENVPSLIKIENHQNWLSDGKLTAHSLGLYVSRRGHKTYLFSFTDQLHRIKRNPIYTDDERFEHIADYMESIVFALQVDQKIELNLRALIGDRWSLLPFKIRKFICSGLFLFDLFDQKGDMYVDISPASIGITKGVETIIADLVQVPFRDFCHAQTDWPILQDLLKADLADPKMRRLAEFILSKEIRPLELGSFNFYVFQIINGSGGTSKCLLLLQEYFITQNSFDFFLAPLRFNEVIHKITSVYRNGAAHTKEMEFDRLLEYVTLLLGEPEKPGFLKELVDAVVKP